MPGLLTYFHTLRYLRIRQIYGRLWFRFFLIRPNLSSAPLCRTNDDRWILPARRPAIMIGPDGFQLLGQVHFLAKTFAWDDPGLDKLFRYNLNYFDDLNATGAKDRREWHHDLMRRWVAENPPGQGSAWEPYPTSLRIINWIKWALNGNVLPEQCVHSLAVQVRWLSQRLEVHLLGNHLFSNAKALVFAGLYFSGLEAERWINRGMHILQREISEQILPDGGQFERSPMYHILALEDMLDLVNITEHYRRSVPTKWRTVIQGWLDTINVMNRWMTVMCHPDGEIGFFNDSAINIAPGPIEVNRYSRALGFVPYVQTHSTARVTHLSDSGYLRVEQDAAVILMDVGVIGPDYLPGHAHADTLSFELSLSAQRVFVNSGTSCYGYGAERLRQRGTSAHNTVVVNGENSSEVWSGFRVARRARPFGLSIQDKEAVNVRCSHNGYQRLAGRPIHTRTWAIAERQLTVSDLIEGPFTEAEMRLHLHPEVRITSCSSVNRRIELLLPDGRMVFVEFDNCVLKIESSTWHPGFGTTVDNLCLVAKFKSPSLQTRINWLGK